MRSMRASTGGYAGIIATLLIASSPPRASAVQPATLGREVPHDWPLVYEQPFDGVSAAADFACTDPAAWRLDRGSLWQFEQSRYEPPHRSPLNIALLATERVGSFVLEADLMQTGREYGHRDMCVVFGFGDPDHYCYAHLSSSADENAHNVFVVDGAPRTPITAERTGGVDWGWDRWHRLRVEREVGEGTVRVFLDGEQVLFSDRVPPDLGYIGFGSFDDEGRVDNIRVWADHAEAVRCAAFEPMREGAREGGVRFERLGDRVRVSLGDEPFAEYIFRGVQKPCLAPVIGPGGVRMTRAFPFSEPDGESHDHPHHTGLWWAHGDINGHDLWQGDGRLTITDGPTTEGQTITATYSLDTADGPTGVTVAETVRFDETLGGDRVIDFGVTLRAEPGEELVFGDTKEGTMAIRTNASLRLTPDARAVPEVTGHAVNSEGVEGKALWGKRAGWVDYWGQIDGRTVGVAIFDSPKNYAYPTWWHARDYGLVGANPFGVSAFEGGGADRGRMVVEPGKEASFHYRFYFHRFGAAEARVGDAFDAWAAEEGAR